MTMFSSVTISNESGKAMNIEQLTIGEVAKIEELADQSIDAMADPTAPKAKMMAAMVYVLKRREDPAYKFSDAMNIPMSELDGLLGGTDGDKA